MGSLDNSVIARLVSGGEIFEILLDAAVMDVIGQVRRSDLLSYLIVDSVFRDAKRGIRPTKDEIVGTFGTTDIEEIAARVVSDGKIQLTTEQRRKMLETKKSKVITRIADAVVDPKTRLPHPVGRIELALKECKFHVDMFKPVDEQVKDAIHAIECLIPVEPRKALDVRVDDYVDYRKKLSNSGVTGEKTEKWFAH